MSDVIDEMLVPPDGFATMREYRLHVLESMGVDTAGLAAKCDDTVWAHYDFHLAQVRRRAPALRLVPPLGES